MGGTAGHATHLWEDTELTFGELKALLVRVASLDVTDVSEKMDGQQLLVTWDGRQVRCARNKGDIKSGGMTAEELAAKFAGRGSVRDAFVEGFKTVDVAVRSLSADVRQKVFRGGEAWFSIEVIYSKNSNVINYGIDAISFHQLSQRAYDSEGRPIDVPWADDVFDELMSHVETMRKAAAQRKWQVHGSSVGALKPLTDGAALRRAEQAIDFAMDMTGMFDGDTIGDHLVSAVVEHIDNVVPGLDGRTLEDAGTRLALGRGPLMRDVLAKLNPKGQALMKKAIEGTPAVIERATQPLERAVTGFAIEFLRGLDSVFVLDQTGEVERLRGGLQSAVDAIKSVGGPEAQAIMQKQLSRLQGGISDVGTAAEGIMFRDPKSGKVYKLTGAFAALNAIMGLFKYGRGKIPPIQKQTEAAVRSFVRSCIVAG